MTRLLLITTALLITITTSAQKAKKERKEENRKRINAMIRQEEEGVIAYRRHTVYGAKFINNGYGAFLEIGRASSVKKAMLFQLELSERKSPKEEKSGNYSAPYIYGKQNFIYPVRLGVQQQILIGNKSNKNGVSVTGNYGGGLALALVRPYYVQISSSDTYVKYNSPDSSAFLGSNISGGPGFSKGWKDLSVNPGAYLKTAIRFDYGSYNEIVSALEAGITAEYYSKDTPVMVRDVKKQFFFSGYVAILFGRRK